MYEDIDFLADAKRALVELGHDPKTLDHPLAHRRASHEVGSGEGYKECADGVERWGLYGAAGLLIIHDDKDGTWCLLEKRSEMVHMGGNWGIPGGALDKHESALEGALREAQEEMGLDIKAELVRARAFEPAADWAYTTCVVKIQERFDAPTAQSWESDEYRWIHSDELTALDLHPGLRASLEAGLLENLTRPNLRQTSDLPKNTELPSQDLGLE